MAREEGAFEADGGSAAVGGAVFEVEVAAEAAVEAVAASAAAAAEIKATTTTHLTLVSGAEAEVAATTADPQWDTSKHRSS